ncbi:MAG: hypothetical protein IJ251_02615 [Oscillospiraceae bacterium]|nr:hypothetical protein [Oscillospiraceae bacterium]
MQRFACEMCGSSELLKDGDFFVCQSCGTKYTPEAAKKMMVEGTVTVDRSKELNNLYTLARRARETDNIEDGAKYYNQLVQLDPNNWEAYFFSVYFSQLECKIYQISSAAGNIRQALSPTIDLIESIPDNVQKSSAYSVLGASVIEGSNMLLNVAYSHYCNNSSVDGTMTEYGVRRDACYSLIKSCADLFADRKAGKKTAFTLYKKILINKRFNIKNNDRENIWKKMHECDPDFDAESMIKAERLATQKNIEKDIEREKESEKTSFIIALLLFAFILLLAFLFFINFVTNLA